MSWAAGAWGWQPVSNRSVHALQIHVFGLTAAAQPAGPQLGHLRAKGLYTHAVSRPGDAVVVRRRRHHRAPLAPWLGNRPVHGFSQRGVDRQQRGLQNEDAGIAWPGSPYRRLAVLGVVVALAPGHPGRPSRPSRPIVGLPHHDPVARGMAALPLRQPHGLRRSIAGLHAPRQRFTRAAMDRHAALGAAVAGQARNA